MTLPKTAVLNALYNAAIFIVLFSLSGCEPSEIKPVDKNKPIEEKIIVNGLSDKDASVIAYYPLLTDATDTTGINEPLTLINAPFENGGVYSNGIYANGLTGADPDGVTIQTPVLKSFNYQLFSVSVDFKVDEMKDQPVWVIGNACRWLGFMLRADGKVSLLYNNNNYFITDKSYVLNEWQNARISFDGTTAKIYLNNILAGSITKGKDFEQLETCDEYDNAIGVTNFSNGAVLKGSIRHLLVTTLKTNIETEPPVIEDELTKKVIGYYPMLIDGIDTTGINEPLTMVNASFQDGGLYSNGIYSMGVPDGVTILTPTLKSFNHQLFSVSVDFKVAEKRNQPVWVIGTSCRWLGVYLRTDGKVALLYNNNLFHVTDATYTINEWQNARVTFDGTTAKIYLNNVYAGEIVKGKDFLRLETCGASDTQIGVINFSNGGVLKGLLRNLKILSEGDDILDIPAPVDPSNPPTIINNRIASYPMLENGLDSLGVNQPLALLNAPFQNGGIYSNGIQYYDGEVSSNPAAVMIETPVLNYFDQKSFSISIDFKVDVNKDQPVWVIGKGCRWLGFYLLEDGTVSLQYNNGSYLNTDKVYALNKWQNAKITFDGTTAEIFLNNVLAGSIPNFVPLAECGDNDTVIRLGNSGDYAVFEGHVKQLKITSPLL
jgi:hypothetical protein